MAWQFRARPAQPIKRQTGASGIVSSFAWLDHSEQQRRRMLEIVGLFREQGTVDELGIGAVRDAIADTLFPATSTLHTRPRYLLFVPWLYLGIERDRVSGQGVADRLKRDELRLIEALVAGGEREGVIGVEARARLRRFPSNVYWNALATLGIRTLPGSQPSHHRHLDSYYRRIRQAQRSDEEDATLPAPYWHASLPQPPDGLLEETTFTLRREEAAWLQERYLDRLPDSYLSELLTSEVDDLDEPAVDAPWHHPALARARTQIRVHVEHARCFSELMYGAALLYNLLLAEKVNEARRGGADLAVSDDLSGDYRDWLDTWAAEVKDRADAYEQWERPRFWDLVLRRNPRVSLRTRSFIERWLSIAIERPESVVDDRAARELVAHREIAVKGALARVTNLRALERWNGASGTEPLLYRWRQTRRLVSDVRAGQNAA